MSLRISSATLLLLLLSAACGDGPATAVAQGDPAAHVACAHGAAPETTCRLEHDGEILVIRRPDGGFRRFEIGGDGLPHTADGADDAAVGRQANGSLTVRIGDDRYRFAASQMKP